MGQGENNREQALGWERDVLQCSGALWSPMDWVLVNHDAPSRFIYIHSAQPKCVCVYACVSVYVYVCVKAVPSSVR
jgi:hypothetical protein